MTEDRAEKFKIEKICLLLLIAKGIEKNFELKEAYLRGYRAMSLS